MEETRVSVSKKQEQYYQSFEQNLNEGINYYQNLFSSLKDKFEDTKSGILTDLEANLNRLKQLKDKA
jgi:flagellar biosynthesis chaperone FliJ